jgi:triosephosphate isomerase
VPSESSPGTFPTDTSANDVPSITVGVSLKMYFGYEETLAWCEKVRLICLSSPPVMNGSVEVFVIPSYPVLDRAGRVFSGSPIGLGAQNLHWEDVGAYTGEVSGAMLAELGCRYVEIGHAERRRIFHETDDIVARKTVAALRNGLVPVICVGEPSTVSRDESLEWCLRQIDAALNQIANKPSSRVIVAYEPIWAIGAPEAAPPDHIKAICAGIRSALQAEVDFRVTLIYGGAAGPGLLSELRGCVDGLFLGRSVHAPAALELILGEVAALIS